MGTRSLTVFTEDNGNEIVVMYRQFDGYMDGHGKALADFLAPMKVVYGFQEKVNVANGMGCLAAQVVAHFKDGVGCFYLYPAGTRGCNEEYTYFVSAKDGKPWLKCLDGADVVYEGFADDFKVPESA